MSMFSKVFEYQPSEQDYRIWLVVNPKVWLIPILAAVLVVGLAIHWYVLTLPQYTWPQGHHAAQAVAAPAPAATPAAAAK
jgi:hypothetical protein